MIWDYWKLQCEKRSVDRLDHHQGWIGRSHGMKPSMIGMLALIIFWQIRVWYFGRVTIRTLGCAQFVVETSASQEPWSKFIVQFFCVLLVAWIWRSIPVWKKLMLSGRTMLAISLLFVRADGRAQFIVCFSPACLEGAALFYGLQASNQKNKIRRESGARGRHVCGTWQPWFGMCSHNVPTSSSPAWDWINVIVESWGRGMPIRIYSRPPPSKVSFAVRPFELEITALGGDRAEYRQYWDCGHEIQKMISPRRAKTTHCIYPCSHWSKTCSIFRLIFNNVCQGFYPVDSNCYVASSFVDMTLQFFEATQSALQISPQICCQMVTLVPEEDLELILLLRLRVYVMTFG